jgi:hypothetical protein
MLVPRPSTVPARGLFTATVRSPAAPADSPYILSGNSDTALDAHVGALIVRLLAPLDLATSTRRYPEPGTPADHILSLIRQRRVRETLPLFHSISGVEIVIARLPSERPATEGAR